MNIGTKLYEIRKYMDLTLDDMAKKLSSVSEIDVSRSAINRWENGQSIPNATNVSLYAKAFDIDLNYLFGISPEPKSIKKISSHTYTFNPAIASAGLSGYDYGYTNGETIELPDDLLGKYAGRKDLEFVKVNGESMNNLIQNGSVVAYTTSPALVNLKAGDIVLYRYQSEYGIKHYYDLGDEVIFKPNSNMEQFQEQRYPKDEYLEIIGKVVIYSVFM